jgi:methylated-DNA-[protein]-cysteine S-methyltransferase
MKLTFNYTIVDTILGQILIVASQEGLRSVSIHTSRRSAKESAARLFPDAIESPDVFGDLPQRLERYAYGERIAFNDKLDFGVATKFQQVVWAATRAIPHGETRTYEWLAQRIGNPRSTRAVGQALKRNPFPILIPCHRVIGKDGGLTGFSAGIDLKRKLLELEAK